MIQDLSVIDFAGNEAILDLSGRAHFLDEESEAAQILSNEWEVGIKWTNSNSSVILCEKDTSIEGFPSPDLDYVLTIWYESKQYPEPLNAVVFESSGALHKVIEVPPLISKLAKEKGYVEGDYLTNPSWHVVPETKEVQLVVDVSFGLMFYERRVLDLKSGEFGICIMTGRL